jgi:hypothetical protein
VWLRVLLQHWASPRLPAFVWGSVCDSPVLQAATEGLLWAMERMTFRALILSSLDEKRDRHERVLERVGIFKSLGARVSSRLGEHLVGLIPTPSIKIVRLAGVAYNAPFCVHSSNVTRFQHACCCSQGVESPCNHVP